MKARISSFSAPGCSHSLSDLGLALTGPAFTGLPFAGLPFVELPFEGLAIAYPLLLLCLCSALSPRGCLESAGVVLHASQLSIRRQAVQLLGYQAAGACATAMVQRLQIASA